MSSLLSFDHDIHAVDANYLRPRLAAVHILRGGGRAALIDTGTQHSVEPTMAGLAELGIAPDAVDYVILTHVHLDHAGGAGALMQRLRNARLVVHPRGAAHMIAPEKLIAGSIAVYGESAYRQLYGELVPVAAERVETTSDGDRIVCGGRELVFLHTPGHALHHQVIVDRNARAVFTGDNFGISYRELDVAGKAFVIPTTTPTQFDPEQFLASLQRILAEEPNHIYMTHFSQVGEVTRLGRELRDDVLALAGFARELAALPDAKARIAAAIAARWRERLAQHGWQGGDTRFRELLGMDIELNTQGLLAWQARARAG
ncbi:MAG: MBL fold metallo-hydrolase [Steroidobacteraceae bacterium]